ncbi:MAG TPA: hypothetical protein VL284_12625 [Thermoanaerobaculia bacterium]|nr:hypothetical protein [Thermoanaerobaculia bacterium]
MNKIVLGLLLGAVLGAVDGATAWFTPEVRAQIAGIIVGSTVKGMIAGVAAGWFARKVQNTAAGIAFGIVVGAVLAYLIVLANGNKYFFAIMLPGTCVGAICGWATQRYGAVKSSRAAAGVAAMLLLVAVGARADAPSAADAFNRMKSLAGTWNGKLGEMPFTVTYRVTGGGSTLVETLFGGTPHEMVTMYTLDEGTLEATHYCAAGNQPTLRYNAAKSSADKLVFDFVGVRGPTKTGYMHDAEFHLGSGDTLQSKWNGVNANGEAADSHEFSLTRVKSSQ